MCKHYDFTLEESHRYFINSAEDNNCVFCLIDRKGSMTQEEIAEFFGLSKMRICQIEKEAISKINKRIKNSFTDLL